MRIGLFQGGPSPPPPPPPFLPALESWEKRACLQAIHYFNHIIFIISQDQEVSVLVYQGVSETKTIFQ
jgi:hypothetical protein